MWQPGWALSTLSDVAVFWPASGLAAGILIISNRRVRPAIVVGVIIGTVAAYIMSDRSIWTSLFKGFCNAGEAVLVAWLIERWFGRPFAFDDLRRVLGFVAAACLGAAASALGGAATMTLLHTAAPFWDVWRAWFLSDGVGIVMVAPLVVALDQAWSKQSLRTEAVEAVGVLAVLALIISYAVTHLTGSWLSFDADAVVLPLLLWLVARCKPVFGVAGAFICVTRRHLRDDLWYWAFWGCSCSGRRTRERRPSGHNDGDTLHARSSGVVRPAQRCGETPDKEERGSCAACTRYPPVYGARTICIRPSTKFWWVQAPG